MPKLWFHFVFSKIVTKENRANMKKYWSLRQAYLKDVSHINSPNENKKTGKYYLLSRVHSFYKTGTDGNQIL